jgi:pyruvate,water dikinase
MKVAAAIVTDQGGRTSHAAIVSRELGIPCIVGTKKATRKFKTGDKITVSCAEGEVGNVYQGLLPFKVRKTNLKKLRRPRTKIMMNLGNPQLAFADCQIPNDGVGLARLEFIFSNYIKVHPLALFNYSKIKDQSLKNKIDKITAGYKSKKEYFIDRLACGIARLAAGFYPKTVIVRTSDFKTNEYATMIGGKEYEPHEENPMIGWRGASRYYSHDYQAAFELECQALRQVRDEMGLSNVVVMIPFCRTVEEGKKVIKIMEQNGLRRGKNGLQVYVMCEIPANVIIAKDFAQIFDGFSIGSNDLTQLVLGLDRDSTLVSGVGNERHPAVKKFISQVIKEAHQYKRKVGICGQAPSDFPDFAEWLIKEGIDSISLTPDSVMKTMKEISRR